MRVRRSLKTIQKIESLLPKPRGNFVVERLNVLSAMLYDAEAVANGALCLDARVGRAIYRRFRRRAENGVLSQVLEVLQKEELIGADFSVLSLDSTLVKSSPSAAGALKKRTASDRADEGRKTTRDQGLCDRRGADDAGRAKTRAWERQRRARRSRNASKS